MNDQQAISRLKNGDIGGLEYLVSKYQEKALRTAYLITHNRQLSEDVVQETFVRMYQRIRSFDDQRPFEPYLMRSVVNTAINQAEKNLNFVNLDEQITMIDVGNLLKSSYVHTWLNQ
ncbi:RNA polymerase sigma factor [Leptolinea tardivitalis]|uniref:RNA polymerase sigma factor n=1 Tax=Leptolinea tardivitalis TaxID=229920 RepID=UPI000784B0A0|nr:sigma-70 family RNA polymerase sigma factor [Leptolinea tardivitalis]GAP22612.1 RNA polymerase sigma factor, sigma-70 family [Leptolinea tardivitalis]